MYEIISNSLRSDTTHRSVESPMVHGLKTAQGFSLNGKTADKKILVSKILTAAIRVRIPEAYKKYQFFDLLENGQFRCCPGSQDD